eukprot:TRINITY_DN82600_c0_g1_i1.p1 TRINITY_DN82600_c0_g1~~TRINITY_DN82600_c0_g1_i1.p1  ORF type:complete len:408 (-),score=77.14 TRINITY_DN82600_c0_g1_i1:260-1417(-)
MSVAVLLLERKANPNSRGEFDRTPLWRASYAGHTEMVQLLLEAGADPRLYTEQAEAPGDVASKDEILELLLGCDLDRVDELVEDFRSWSEDIRLAEMHRQAEAMHSVDAELDDSKRGLRAAQSQLAHAKATYRRRVEEYDLLLVTAQGAREDVMSLARQVCQESEEEVAAAESAACQAQSRYDKAMSSRMMAAEACGATEEKGVGREVVVRELNNVLIRDIGDHIASSDKWPLVIDPSDCAGKMLQYTGCAVLNFWRPGEVTPEKVRLALLSMIRGGGVLAIDLFAVSAGTSKSLLAEPFEAIRPGLFDEVLDRSILQIQKGETWPRYRSLIDKATDGKRFAVEVFDDSRTRQFKVAIITSSPVPHPDLLELFDVIRVIPGNSYE